MKAAYISVLFFSIVSSTFVFSQSCPLSGDVSPCGDVTLSEIVNYINDWSRGDASLSDVINLINAWAATNETGSDKPVAELFVMSHCPYGLQMEKGLIPVLDALNDSINFSVHFCSYSMHGKKELDEQLLQHCIQKEHNDVFLGYLHCFLADGNTSTCLNESGLSYQDVSACIDSTDAYYNVSAGYYNVSDWLYGRYPPFGVDLVLDEKYGIYSSPTLIVDSSVTDTGRDPRSLLATLCAAYAVKPVGCYVNLSDATPSPGFGYGGTGGDGGSC